MCLCMPLPSASFSPKHASCSLDGLRPPPPALHAANHLFHGAVGIGFLSDSQCRGVCSSVVSLFRGGVCPECLCMCMPGTMTQGEAPGDSEFTRDSTPADAKGSPPQVTKGGRTVAVPDGGITAPDSGVPAALWGGAGLPLGQTGSGPAFPTGLPLRSESLSFRGVRSGLSPGSSVEGSGLKAASSFEPCSERHRLFLGCASPWLLWERKD